MATVMGRLESGAYSLDDVVYTVGDESIIFFRNLFVRLMGIRPKEYQQRFLGHYVKRAWKVTESAH
jgi:methylphosphotriester-DNA--protein-cysteine methyltransferase